MSWNMNSGFQIGKSAPWKDIPIPKMFQYSSVSESQSPHMYLILNDSFHINSQGTYEE